MSSEYISISYFPLLVSFPLWPFCTTVLALHLDFCVIRKLCACLCVCTCVYVRVCVHVILHNPIPSVMTVITSPSLYISDSAHTHTHTWTQTRIHRASRIPKLSHVPSTPHYWDYILLHCITSAGLSPCGVMSSDYPQKCKKWNCIESLNCWLHCKQGIYFNSMWSLRIFDDVGTTTWFFQIFFLIFNHLVIILISKVWAPVPELPLRFSR